MQASSINDAVGLSSNEEDLTIQECLNRTIQNLCNGTKASPCNCQQFQECQVSSSIV